MLYLRLGYLYSIDGSAHKVWYISNGSIVLPIFMANTTKTYFYREHVHQAESFDTAIGSLED
jgi:hypothetical protein